MDPAAGGSIAESAEEQLSPGTVQSVLRQVEIGGQQVLREAASPGACADLEDNAGDLLPLPRGASQAHASDTEPDATPDGWESAWDSTHERLYYFNRETEERVWNASNTKRMSISQVDAIAIASNETSGHAVASNSDAIGRADAKRRTFRDLVHMQARSTKELQNISETMSAVCTEMRHMRQLASTPSQCAGLHDSQPSPSPPLAVSGLDSTFSKFRWEQRRREFQKRRCTEELRHLFAECGLDLQDRITHLELGAVITKPALRTFFEQRLHVSSQFLEEVFYLLDLDNDHKASLAEFIEGCIELKDEDAVREGSPQSCFLRLALRMSESIETMSTSMERANPEPDTVIRPLEPYDHKSLPEVEVAIRVNHLSNVDTSVLRFEADFTIFLDWVDERIPDDVEAHQLDWDNVFFNPHIVVEGMEEAPTEPSPCSDHPLFARPEIRPGANPDFVRKQSEWLTRDGRECKWCTKMYRYRGTLCMPEVDLRCFPFDFQMLPLKVRAQRLTLGDVKNAFVRLASPESHDGSVEALRIRRLCRQYNSREAKFRHNGSYCASTPSDSCMADCMVEFRIYGLYSFPARSLLDAKGEAFQVTVVVQRPVLGHQLGEFAVLVLLTLLSAVSFWDTASPELSSRMSITLTIILTLAVYTSQRPAAIDKVPYATVQDHVELVAMYFVMFVAVLNVVAVVCCGGESEEAPSRMQAVFRYHQDELCSESVWGMRRIDFFGFVCFIGVVLVSTAVTFQGLRVLRHRTLKRKLKEGVELLELAGGKEFPGAEVEDDLPTLTMPSNYLLDQKNWDFRIKQKVQRVIMHMCQERHRAQHPSAHAWGRSSSTKRSPSMMRMWCKRVAPEPTDDE